MVDAAVGASRRRAATLGEGAAAWLLSLPAIGAYLALLLIPTFAVAALSLTDYELGLPGASFVGLDNYAALLRDRGLIEAGARGRTFFRAVFFLPVVSLIVAMATAWQYLLHPTIGPVNSALRTIGLGTPNWLGSSDWVLTSLGLISIWENAGFNMVLIMAGLTAIPRELYAAAEVDGAKSAWERFRLVTWPLLGPSMLFVTIITTIRAIRTFDTVATLTQGGPTKASELIVFTIYQEGFTFLRMGYASAMTIVFLAAVLVLMLIQTRLVERRVHYG